MTREDRRMNRKHILKALESETGSLGGGTAPKRVTAYCADPVNAPIREFGFVGGLSLQRFYVAPDKPNQKERRSLWTQVFLKMNVDEPDDPGDWDGTTTVITLQQIVEDAAGLTNEE